MALFHAATGHDLTPAEGVTFMLCVKLARLGHNVARGEFHRDSAVDLAGYAECLHRVMDP